jgi:fibronectin-binding autotransporter adhesin
VVNEALTVTGCSILTVNGAPVANRAAISADSVSFTGACAMLAGTGYIDADSVTFSQGATLNPGNSPGVMVFSGDLILENSTTVMELAGNDPGTGYDYVNILGRFVIGENAVLNVNAINGFVPATGQTFNLFDFDPELLEGDFTTFVNGTGRNYVYSPSTGVLVTLGVENGTGNQQAAELAQTLATSADSTNTSMSSVLTQLINPGTESNSFVGAAAGGYLIPALTGTDPADRAAIFARFTPEGYGGVYEYAYRSLNFGRSFTGQVDLRAGPMFFGDVAVSGHGIGSANSTSLSDYTLSYSTVSASAGMQTEQFAFGFELGVVDGSANVGNILRSTGSGQNLEFGAVVLIRSTENSSLQAYATIQTGRHELNGSRTAIVTTTNFDDVESTADVFRIGAQYVWTTGRTSFTLDGALMRGRVGAMTLTETGGDLNDRLTLSIPSTDVMGGSLSLSSRSQLSDRFTLTTGVDVDVTHGLNDYAITSTVGSEAMSFVTNVPGIDSVLANVSVGGEFALTSTSTLSTSAYLNGLGTSASEEGAEVELRFEF